MSNRYVAPFRDVHPVKLKSSAAGSFLFDSSPSDGDAGVFIRRESPKSVIRSWQSLSSSMLAGFRSRSVVQITSENGNKLK